MAKIKALPFSLVAGKWWIPSGWEKTTHEVQDLYRT